MSNRKDAEEHDVAEEPDMAEEPDVAEERSVARDELIFTIVLAIAAVATAWCGFQSTKWSGEQADAYAVAGAYRVESTRHATEAGQLVMIDTISFTQWISALQAEIIADPSARPTGAYEPQEGTVSGFLHSRFRDEFRPAFDAWVALRPMVDPTAPSTPFAMPEYHLASRDRAEALLADAEASSAAARRANQIGDNYILLGVMFALVLFFVALGGRAKARRTRRMLLVVAVATFALTCGVLVTFPVTL